MSALHYVLPLLAICILPLLASCAEERDDQRQVSYEVMLPDPLWSIQRTEVVSDDTGHHVLLYAERRQGIGPQVIEKASGTVPVPDDDRPVKVVLIGAPAIQPGMAAFPNRQQWQHFHDMELAAGHMMEQVPGTGIEELAGSTWKLQKMIIDGEEVALGDAEVTLSIREEGAISGKAAVNNYFGAIGERHDGSVGVTGPLGSTNMAGPEEQMRIEQQYLSRFPQSNRLYHHEVEDDHDPMQVSIGLVFGGPNIWFGFSKVLR